MTILSPNAQAILDAVKHYETNHWCHVSHVAATVLLVIAEQIQPGRNPLDDSDAAAGAHAAGSCRGVDAQRLHLKQG